MPSVERSWAHSSTLEAPHICQLCPLDSLHFLSQVALSLKTPFTQERICQVQWIPATRIGRLLTSKGAHQNQNGLSFSVLALEFMNARPKEHDDNLKACD